MRVIIIRHGETDWNVGKIRFRGRQEIELSKFGIQQADATGKALQKEEINAIFYGPLKRTKQTAERIKKYQPLKKFFEEPLLIDMNFGDWEGKTMEEVFTSNPGVEEKWKFHPADLQFPNGESWQDIFERINSLFKKLKAMGEQTILLITHKVVISVIFTFLLNLSINQLWIFNIEPASISEVTMEKDGTLKVIKTNDIHHLSKLK